MGKVAAIIMLALWGCAKPCEQQIIYKTEYVNVAVPMPCDIAEPQAPAWMDDPNLMAEDYGEYTLKLLKAFRACKGEK